MPCKTYGEDSPVLLDFNQIPAHDVALLQIREPVSCILSQQLNFTLSYVLTNWDWQIFWA